MEDISSSDYIKFIAPDKWSIHIFFYKNVGTHLKFLDEVFLMSTIQHGFVKKKEKKYQYFFLVDRKSTLSGAMIN